jgi:catechol 2,3-dioxygenase-like lactoylglutathione lyase family enzyme
MTSPLNPTGEESIMLENSKAYSGFAVDDLHEARKFYGETLGLKLTTIDEENGLMSLELAGDRTTLVYVKPDLSPANYTILNFPVDDIDQAVDELSARGVRFERYDGFDQDEKGVFRGGGPNIAWFKDPAGNVLSVLEDG